MSGDPQTAYIDYTNWRGERSYRRVRPLRVVFENNEWHPDTQWLLEAIDLEKEQVRTFAMAGIHKWFAGAVIETAKELLREKVSTSYLQRKMQITYNSAAALMEFFEKTGLISEPSDCGVRTLLASGQYTPEEK
jgi:DNA segregation ATPase FtsK/SpoIIIE-like protein